jgi:hypothetical protein
MRNKIANYELKQVETEILKLSKPNTYAMVRGVKMSDADLTPLIKPQWLTDLTVEVLMQDTIAHHKMEANYNVLPATTYLAWKVSISLGVILKFCQSVQFSIKY